MRPLLLLLTLLASAPSQAQRAVIVSGGLESLSSDYRDGRTLDASLTLPRTGGWTRLDAGVLDRFGEQTVLLGVAASHNLGERTLVTGSTGVSGSGVIAPRVAAAVLVGRRVREDKKVVLSGGAGFREARDGHFDIDALAEVAVYLDGAVLQVGGRVSQSRPGPALGGGGYVAFTVGQPDARMVIGKLAAGHEAWTILAPDQRLDVGFQSGEATLTWREPITGPWSATLTGGLYANPYYTRLGVRTGIVRRF